MFPAAASAGLCVLTYTAFRAALGPAAMYGPFAGFVQTLAPALRGQDFGATFEPFAVSIGVGRLPEPERERVLTTQRIDQQLVLDYWFKPLTESPVVLQGEIDALLDRVTVPYLWLADHLLAHIAQAQVETWSDLGHMAHLAEPDRFAARLSHFITSAVKADT